MSAALATLPLSTPAQEATTLLAINQADVEVAKNNRVLELPNWSPFALMGICNANNVEPGEVFTVTFKKMAPGLDVTTEVEQFLDKYPLGSIRHKKIV